MNAVWSIFLGLIVAVGKSEAVRGCKPHILLIVTDDMGHRDVSWNSPDMRTPFLEKLKNEGVNMENAYMNAACSASRMSLLTGYNAYRMGFQRNEMSQSHRWRNLSLPEEVKILPEYMRCQGYATHLVGKWQMGFCNWNKTPTRRGFDTFYGTYGGNQDHYTHVPDVGGYDMRDNLNVDWSAEGKYSTHLYTNRTVKIIEDHAACGDKRPLFIYLSYEAPHVPVQAPPESIAKCSHIADEERKTRCGMMSALDDGVKQVVEALTNVEYDENLLIVFTSDNGAPGSSGGSNFPLRGKKRGVYEGGIKVPSFLWSKNLLVERPFAYRGLFHVTDWLPTLLRVARGNKIEQFLPDNTDGIDQWHAISRNHEGPRTEVVLDLDEAEGYAAVRKGDYKLIRDPAKRTKEKAWGWFNPPAGTDLKKFPKKRMEDEWQLYNLKDDPYETLNLIGKAHLATLEKAQKKENNMIYKDVKKLYYQAIGQELYLDTGMNITASFPENFGGAWSPGWC